MTTSHTPTPWRIAEYDEDQIEVVAGNEVHICFCNADRLENAEFIVRACNAHHDLVAAIELMLPHIDGRPCVLGHPNWELFTGIFKKALAKAKETQT